MYSYNFHFERMSNLDLHPLSLPVSRLSPAKSNSSLVDQLTHHQHSKGDSAYSSFSGGSTAPDYPSSFLPEDLQSSSLHHYTDLKYVRAIYHPNQVLQSDAKTMDQLYRSVEAISKQYQHNNNVNHHSRNGSNSCLLTDNKAFCDQEVPPVVPSPVPLPLLHHPPPPPARLDSFITTRNLENSWVHQHQGAEPHTQQQQPGPHSQLHQQSQLQNAQVSKSGTPDAGSSGLRSDSVYGGRWGLQQQLQPPSHPQLQSAICEQQQKSVNILNQSPPRSASHSEYQKHRQPSEVIEGDENHSGNSQFEGQRKRAHSAHECLDLKYSRAASPWNVAHNFINSSIQHKGQFYFVTGVCKPVESSVRLYSVSPCASEAGSESSTIVETPRVKKKDREKERCHSTLDNLFRPHSRSDSISSEGEVFTSLTKEQDMISRSLDEENCREIHMTESQENSRHMPNHPIFYCGPEESCLPLSTLQTKEVSSGISNEHRSVHRKDEQGKKGKRQPLGDVASERINKETTPLLYHLTGASRALKPKTDIDFTMKGKETNGNKSGNKEISVSCNEKSSQGEMATTEKGELINNSCNNLDDSFKKYYKEKLKDAQSKVLRETSFKRRDLQLSWPHRIRLAPELRPTVMLSFSSSQDSETSTDTLTPSVASEETGRGSMREQVQGNEKEGERESEKENGRHVNMAQPQVARIGGRKRLTPAQKKMCYSEPEKLNQLGDAQNHHACCSLSDEAENLFQADSKREEPVQQGEQGLVAARRKMFETRGRALSASNLSKTNLKHLQHKALVEYMERKTGQKIAEPQKQGTELPLPPRQRHSVGEKPFDWGSKPLSGANVGQGPKKKLHRPHSAGRILDSSTSSIRYAQFISAQTSLAHCGSQPRQTSWKETQFPSQGRSASVESLLDPAETPCLFRNRSTSTPHALQTHYHEKDPSPVNTMETCSLQKKSDGESIARTAPEGQRHIRVVAQRGKSMEELGASKLTKSSALSKSSEQLDQLKCQSNKGGMVTLRQDKEKRRISFINKGHGEAEEVQEREKNVQMASDKAEQRLEDGLGKAQAQGRIQNLTRRKFLPKQASEPPLGSEVVAGPPVSAGAKSSSRSTSPASSSSSQARVHSRSPGSQSSVAEVVGFCRLSSEASDPPSPRGRASKEEESKSTSSTPPSSNSTKPPNENRLSPRVQMSSAGMTPEQELSVDEPSGDVLCPDSQQEVSLSCGVTTDPSLWIFPPEQGIKVQAHSSSITDNTLVDDCVSPASPVWKSESSISSPSPANDTDTNDQSVEREQAPETIDDKSGQQQRMEEIGATERDTTNLGKPNEMSQWEELVEAVVKEDHSLARVLYPLTNRKTALMLMEQLLSEDTLLMEEHYKQKQEQRGASDIVETVEHAEASLSPSSSDNQVPQCPTPQNQADITEKKRSLMARIEERLRVVEETRGALQMEIEENVAQGGAVEVLVREHCLPVELERYTLFIGDLERVVSLLLCLSARLARVQNALSTVDQHTDTEEKQSLDNRHRLLCKQREDAKDLKDNLDRRENLVSTFLSRQLTAEQLQDYRRFVQTKASLLIRQKDLEERQRLGEEQLEALHSSLPP
ncbi:protein Shroom1 [Lampris incognitus]|uniref:protein Shroom1 n=1 Tax=Lampris incognitus TaxID=2546036 RepID=UPI0024B4A915|nr:protein Shroom1 [Lampris incognitus]